MIQGNNESRLIADIFPSLSQELQGLLVEQDESNLAAQVPQLRVVEGCRCGDDLCSTLLCSTEAEDGYGPGHRSVALTPKTGMLILDVVDEKIACVEVLYRDEIRAQLLVAFPTLD
jgi:hypothetical protein